MKKADLKRVLIEELLILFFIEAKQDKNGDNFDKLVKKYSKRLEGF